MRLIDADCIYNSGDFVILHEDGNAYIKLTDLCKLIDIQPTAYDVDKVVAQLEELRYKDVCDHLECKDCLYNEECGIGTDQTHNVEVDTAIEIVKDGGMK